MRYTILLILILKCLWLPAQDIHFSHITQTKLFNNPAFAGSDQVANLLINHRNYLPTNFGNYMTSQVSYNQKINALHGGIGAQIVSDRQGSGTFNRHYGSLTYAYQFKAQNNIFIYAGLETKFGYLSYNTQDLIFPDMFDPVNWELNKTNNTEEFTSPNDHYVEFNSGILMVYKNYMLRTFEEFSIGFAVHHLNKPGSMLTPENEDIYRKYNFYFDIDIPMTWRKKASNVPTITPVLFVEHQRGNTLFQYGGILKNRSYQFGIFTRHNQLFNYFHLVLHAGFDFSKYSIYYSYDGNLFTNMEKNIFSGAHEVTFTIDFQYKGKEKN